MPRHVTVTCLIQQAKKHSDHDPPCERRTTYLIARLDRSYWLLPSLSTWDSYRTQHECSPLADSDCDMVCALGSCEIAVFPFSIISLTI